MEAIRNEKSAFGGGIDGPYPASYLARISQLSVIAYGDCDRDRKVLRHCGTVLPAALPERAA
jgi:hypothetical protein